MKTTGELTQQQEHGSPATEPRPRRSRLLPPLRTGVERLVRRAAPVRRFSFLPTPPRNANASSRWETLTLTITPVLTFGFVYVAASLGGVAYRPGCNSIYNFFASLLFQAIEPSTCQAVPFLSDIPTIILSFTSPIALVVFRLVRRRLNGLIPALNASGLFGPEGSTSERTAALSTAVLMRDLKRAVDLTPMRRSAVFLVSLGLVTWLYWRNLIDGHLFNTLASDRADADILRTTWWANYHFHPVLALICILLGTVGGNYALRTGLLYLTVGIALYTTHKKSIFNAVRYVPKWQDPSYGWSPLTRVLTLFYISTIALAMSMVAVFDMLRNVEWTLWVAIGVGVLGLTANLVIIGAALYQVMTGHRAVANRLREDLIRRTRPGWTSVSPEEYVATTTELAAWRKLPVGSLTGNTIRILPGVYAFFQFLQTFPGLKH
ncbi:MAG TPA: hypothetical protein VGG05_08275 [Pseudonocardiaceae bacterium]|jgi:hypothetical protein